MRARFFTVLLMVPTIVRGQDVSPQHARPRLLNPMILDTMAVPAADLRERYGTDSLQFGELRVPRGRGPFPVAVVVHGGSAARETCSISRRVISASAGSE